MSDAPDLLAEAQRTLREELAPRLDGEARYLALLAANAVATARRELVVAGPLAALGQRRAPTRPRSAPGRMTMTRPCSGGWSPRRG